MFEDVRVKASVVVLLLVALVCGTALVFGRRSHSPPAPIAISSLQTPTTPLASESSSALSQTRPHATQVTKPETLPSSAASRLYIDVAGAVRRPGLYRLPLHARLANAVAAAGGPAQTADIGQVNLAEPLVDGEKITVPDKAAPITAAPAIPTRTMTSASGTVTLPAVPTGFTQTISPPVPSVNGQQSDSEAGRSGKSGKLRTPQDGKININTASAADLQRLPGVGPSMAAKILAYRQQVGSFKSLDDLREVGGIGDKKLMKIAPFVTLD